MCVCRNRSMGCHLGGWVAGWVHELVGRRIWAGWYLGGRVGWRVVGRVDGWVGGRVVVGVGGWWLVSGEW